MTSTEIIQHLRRGLCHGITITPAEAEGLVELFDKLEADFVRVHGYFLEAAQDNVKIIQEATKIREENEQLKAEIERLKAEQKSIGKRFTFDNFHCHK